MSTRRGALTGLVGVVLLLLACAPGPAAPPAATATTAPARPPQTAATATSAPTAAPAASAPLPLQPPVKVRFAFQYLLTDAPVYLALDRGYFTQEGLDVEPIRIQAAAEAIPQLATGGLEVASGAAAAALYNAVARGADVRIVLEVGGTLPGFPHYVLAVRKDLVDSGAVRDWADLRGLRIANTGTGNGLHRGIDLALARGGLTLADIEMPIMAPPDMLAAFANHAIDAAALFEPYATVGEEQGVLVRWKRSDEIAESIPGGVLLYAPAFIESHREAAQRFVDAYLRGTRDYNDAFLKNRDREAVLATIARNVGIDPAIMAKVYPAAIDPDGRVDVASLKNNQEWFARQGFVQTPVDVDRIVDTSFAQDTVRRLGPYQR